MAATCYVTAEDYRRYWRARRLHEVPNMTRYESSTPRFCKMCSVLLGYDAKDADGPVWVPIMVGTLSVAGVGRYCSHECRNGDPAYWAEFEGGNQPEESE